MAQDLEPAENSIQSAVYICYFSPTAEYPGGFSEWKKFIKKNAKYPYVPNSGAPSTILGFKVLADGKIDSIKVIRSSKLEIDTEAIRLLKLSSPWKPATLENKAISCSMSIRMFPRNY